ncbi:MAG: C-terminal binding protein, partial [Planctomycetes bacterium]|nr:C-terminal binding protein [Planctomycetota bacterium]
MPKFKVLHTDCRWGEADVERDILGEVDAELILAPFHDAETLARLAADCDAIMTCWAAVPESVVAAAPRCRIVARFGIGLDNIDVDYCTGRGIPVTNVPDYCTAEVAEHALALLLALARRVAYFHHETKSGRYDLSAATPMSRLEGQTLGIVGLGNIGSRLAEKAAALGLNVLATGRSKPASPPVAVEWVALDELLARSDFVSLHVPLTGETRHLISAQELALMKPTGYLINTARGGLLDHDALAAALATNRLAGAALDVQDPEPPDMIQPPFCDP